MKDPNKTKGLPHGHSGFLSIWRMGGGSVVLKLAATGTAFATSIVLARSLGPSGYGLFTFVMACITLLALPARSGIATLVIRETAKGMSSGDWHRVKGMWRWSAGLSLRISMVIVLCVFVFVILDREHADSPFRNSLAVGIALVPLIVMIENRSAAIRGLGFPIVGLSSELLIRPGTFLFLVLIVTTGYGVTDVPTLIFLQILATSVAAAFSVAALRKLQPESVRRCDGALVKDREWLRSVIPLSVIVGAQLINTQADILLLGILAGDAETGLYRVSVQGATVVAFGLVAIGAVTMPTFAALFAKNDLVGMQGLATKSARVMLALSIPPFLLYLIAGEDLIEFVFGAEYLNAVAPLLILSLGQVFNAGFGTVGPILNMVGKERETAKWISIAASLNIVLNVLMIPRFGATGAAIATFVSLLLWNLLLWRAAQRSLGINSSAF